MFKQDRIFISLTTINQRGAHFFVPPGIANQVLFSGSIEITLRVQFRCKLDVPYLNIHE